MEGLPHLNDVLHPVLKELANGARNSRECIPGIAAHFGLGADATEPPPGGGSKPPIMARFCWGLVGLGAAGLVSKLGRGNYEVTEEGHRALAERDTRIDHEYLLRYPSYAEIYGPGAASPKSPGGSGPSTLRTKLPSERQSPWEDIEQAAKQIEEATAQQLLDRLRKASPEFFEKAVVDLLLAMGYGRGRDGAGRRIGRTGDGGIDGVIDEDALGLDAVYLQAKRYAPENTVGRPAIQQFVGTLTGEGARKGVFVTTSSFSDAAKNYAVRVHQRVVLIDGAEFARLMIAHGVGVRPVETITLSEIDENFFAED